MDDTRARKIVEAAGGKFVGIWHSMGLVAFDNAYGSTCNIKIEALTIEAVRANLLQSHQAFQGHECTLASLLTR